jgi:hypothetical protein
MVEISYIIVIMLISWDSMAAKGGEVSSKELLFLVVRVMVGREKKTQLSIGKL